MHIYLAKPGGVKEGPFTIEQINEDLTTGKYSFNDYWAWHEGLSGWMPLHALPGVGVAPSPPKPQTPHPKPAPAPATASEATTVTAVSPPAEKSAPASVKPVAIPAVKAAPEPVAPKPAPIALKPVSAAPEPTPVETESAAVAPAPAAGATETKEPKPAAESPVLGKGMASGIPFAALEQVFVFTSGEGRELFESTSISKNLEEIVGEPVETIRGKVPLDVIGHADVGVQMVIEQSIPDKAWRAMAKIKPDAVRRSKEGECTLCARSFSVETNDMVAVFLFYKKG